MVEKIKAGQEQSAAPEAKQLSGTGYPYFDLRDSIAVAELIHAKGGGACDLDQLAAWLGYKSTSSGTFASRLASARHFGLIGSTKGGRIGITDRARAILAPVMPNDALNARVDSFLNVALYKQVFDQFRGTTLPPNVGLGNLFKQQYKILPDRVQQAVRVFKDSATQAGFFQSAPDRLIRPSGANGATQGLAPTAEAPGEPRQEPPVEKRRAAGGGGDGDGIDPSILGLLRQLPQPGARWSAKDQEAFLAAFTAVVKFIYPAKSEADGA